MAQCVCRGWGAIVQGNVAYCECALCIALQIYIHVDTCIINIIFCALSLPPDCGHQGADECVACARNKDGPHCVSTCPKGLMGGEGVIFKYPDRQHNCEPCHLNCTQG